MGGGEHKHFHQNYRTMTNFNANKDFTDWDGAWEYLNKKLRSIEKTQTQLQALWDGSGSRVLDQVDNGEPVTDADIEKFTELASSAEDMVIEYSDLFDAMGLCKQMLVKTMEDQTGVPYKWV